MSENEVKNAIIDYLVTVGALVLRVNSGSVMATDKGKRRFFNFVKWFVRGKEPQTAGCSDILALYQGKFYVIETKTPARRSAVTTAQAAFLAEVERHGGVGLVACGIDEVRRGIAGV